MASTHRLSEKTAWWIVTIALALFAALALAVYFAPHPYFDLDLAFSQKVGSLSAPWLDQVMKAISFPGNGVIGSSVFVAIFVLFLLAIKRWREAVILLGVVLVGQVLKVGLKTLIGRPRPTKDLVDILFESKEIHSFPSGHTVHYVVLFGFLFYLTYHLVQPTILRRGLLVLWAAMILLIGPSRIYLGAHWLSDIIGGYLLGGAILLTGIILYRRWTPQPSSS